VRVRAGRGCGARRVLLKRVKRPLWISKYSVFFYFLTFYPQPNKIPLTIHKPNNKIKTSKERKCCNIFSTEISKYFLRNKTENQRDTDRSARDLHCQLREHVREPRGPVDLQQPWPPRNVHNARHELGNLERFVKRKEYCRKKKWKMKRKGRVRRWKKIKEKNKRGFRER